MAGITYEVLEKFGVLSESNTGWTKELRLVNWNNHGARYDLREWAPGDKKASRGITLSLKEMRILQEMLVEIEFPGLSGDEEYPDTEADGKTGTFGESGGEKESRGTGSCIRKAAKEEKGAKQKAG